MASRQWFNGANRDSIDSPTGPIPGVMFKTDGSRASDFSWPPIVICAILLGFIVAYNFGSAPAMVRATDDLHRLFAWRDQSAKQETRKALVITANRTDQLTAVATLSPRGFHPLLASSRREVLAQIRAHPGTLKLAVVDATLPDYALIARTLRDSIPRGGIIVVKDPHRSQDIGPMLLERL